MAFVGEFNNWWYQQYTDTFANSLEATACIAGTIALGVGMAGLALIWDQIPIDWRLVIIGKSGMDPDAPYNG